MGDSTTLVVGGVSWTHILLTIAIAAAFWFAAEAARKAVERRGGASRVGREHGAAVRPDRPHRADRRRRRRRPRLAGDQRRRLLPASA